MSEKEIVVELPKALHKFEDSFRQAIDEELMRIWLEEHHEDARNYKVKIRLRRK